MACRQGSRLKVSISSPVTQARLTATAPRRGSWKPAYSAGKKKKICAPTLASRVSTSSARIAAVATNGNVTQNQFPRLCIRPRASAAATTTTDVAMVTRMLTGVVRTDELGPTAANSTVTPPATRASVDTTRAAVTRSRGCSAATTAEKLSIGSVWQNLRRLYIAGLDKFY